MVRLVNSATSTAAMASLTNAVASALESPSALRRFYNAYMGATNAAAKMVAIRHV